jgi:ribosomal protein S18 acetylase RimI-like enzyme
MASIKIRKAKLSDKKDFLKTQKEAFPNLNSNKQAQYFDCKIKNREIFLVYDGSYAGHLCFGRHLINPPFSKSVFIEEFAIKEKFRGRGFGTVLIEHLISYCKKNNITIIYTSTGDYKSNRSIAFYEKRGFKKIGFLKNIDPKSEYNYGQVFLGKVIK